MLWGGGEGIEGGVGRSSRGEGGRERGRGKEEREGERES